MQIKSDLYRGKDFWQEENLRYLEPHFRLEKCAQIANALSGGKNCDLLDIGCGPGTLAGLLKINILYFGIDIAIQNPAPNLLELDILHNEIRFEDKTFDIIVMQGVFEYLGDLQRKKFVEIQRILNKGGKFVVTFINCEHLHYERFDNSLYNNVQPIKNFKSDLESFFQIDNWFPTSYNWLRSEPRRTWLKKIQMPLRINLPIISRMLAVEYIFICSLQR